jgi:predicted ATPase/class 3 adenylate cyclase
VRLQFGLLGPLAVWSEDEAVEIKGAKRRGVLAYLLTHAGEPQPVDRIVEALWGDAASEGSAATVQTYVSQLRRLFGTDGPSLVHRAGGYSLELEPNVLDSSRFEAAIGAAAAIDRVDERLLLLEEALSLWRGMPLDEFSGQVWADERARQLTRLHVLAQQMRGAALLDVGRHRDALSSLEGLVAVYPLHEPFWGQLVVARYRCGEQAGALAAASEARSVLARELGIAPGPELQELENKVLTRDPSLDPPTVYDDAGSHARVGTVVDPLPSGIVTFLLTDIEGSTALWDLHPAEMAEALMSHEDLMAEVVHGHTGRLLKSRGEGDATLSVFARATDAVAAAIAVQRRLLTEEWPGDLDLSTRVALHTGEAQLRDGDYFGGTLNRAARIRSIAAGGEVLLSQSTYDVVVDSAWADVGFVKLGEHEMTGLRRSELVYGIQGSGLRLREPRYVRRTVKSVAGNVPIQVTSFVGRDDQLRELRALVLEHRLVTLVGVGGVGKTRLSLELAADASDQFTDGVWVVELAPVSDPASVPDAVATALGIAAIAGQSIDEAIVNAVSGRRVLLVLDNCEHVLRAAADMAERLLTTAPTVHLIAASRERLHLAAEHVWQVPALDVAAGIGSPAVELFVQRATAVNPAFDIDDPEDAAAVTEICERLDGLALAIELAAARMISMSPTDVRDRLRDRFRLLSRPAGGLEHHQTLGRAISWSYDLLDDGEQTLLDRCSVFSDGFDLIAATAIWRRPDLDDYAVLDVLESLVDKSLIVTQRSGRHIRFRLLETIREFADERLRATGRYEEAHQLHASYFASTAMSNWTRWNSPEQRDALDWVDREFANLRASFRWAADYGDLACASAIAAHTTMLTMAMQRFESVGWVEEILPAASAAEIAQLPRLYTAACVCVLMGRPRDAVDRARHATELERDPRFDPFENGWSRAWEAFGHRYSGQNGIDTMFAICDELEHQPGLAHVIGLVLALAVLPGVGRADEARARAKPTLDAARALGNPFWIAYALSGYSRAYAESDPALAMETTRDALEYDRRQRLTYFEANLIRDMAALQHGLGLPEQALDLLDSALALYQGAGNHASLATTLALVAVVFSRLDQPDLAATIYGMSTPHGTSMVASLPDVLHQLRTRLGDETFEAKVSAGATTDFDQAMETVRREIELAQRKLAADSPQQGRPH